MANGKTHLMVGAVSGIALAAIDKKNESTYFSDPLVAGAVGGFFGKLPDLIEPATNPNHRQFFHSVVVFGALIAGCKKMYEWSPEDDFGKALRAVVLVGGVAYMSHLALDALTKKSLPVIGSI